jgi:hypothetical protein
MRVHPVNPDRVLVAAGDGFAESWDFGRCWSWTGDGMEVTYVWDVAIESSEGRNALASASPDARRAHDTGRCESRIYRRDLAPDTPESRDSLPRWRDVSPLSPPVDRRRAPVLSSVPGWPDTYLLCTRRGEMAWTPDAGSRWFPLVVDIGDVADIRVVTVVPGD